MLGMRDEWKNICAKIQGIEDATVYLLRSSGDPRNPNQDFGDEILEGYIYPAMQRTGSAIEKFRTYYGKNLPRVALTALSSIYDQFMSDSSCDSFNHIVKLITAFMLIRSEVTYYLQDNDAVTMRQVERAFIHIRRSIIVDPGTKRQWKTAFKSGEVRCEKLGSLHLLSHGLWAVKVDATGERTDLILGTKLIVDEVEKSANALILTEWKVARCEEDLHQKVRQAINQLRKYSSSSLAGYELSTVRYIVIVTEKALQLPSDFSDENIEFRHINIPVAPSVPSKSTLRRASNRP